ncbi:MAG: sigma 54-interacting transcriptional regulator [Planctomycetota bacterium]
MMRFVLTSGAKSRLTADIVKPVTVGRDATCTLVVPDVRISRQHCVIEESEGRLMLTDTSSNGTRVNGRLVKETALEAGDSIQLAAGVEGVIEEVPATGRESPFETWALGAALPRLHVGMEELSKGMEDLTNYLQALQLCQTGQDVVRAVSAYLGSRVLHDRLALVIGAGCTRVIHKDYGALAKKWEGLPLSLTLVREAMGGARAVLARSSGELSDSHSADVSRISSALAVAIPDASGGALSALYVDRLGESASLGERDLQECARAALALGPALEAALLRDKLAKSQGVGDFVGSCKAVVALRETLAKVSRVDSPVVIEGTSGSGRRHAARLIHDRSARWRAPWVCVDAATLTPELGPSELFGHVKGAFTGASADREGAFARAAGGTLVLEHLDEALPEVQALLLRVLDAAAIRPVGSNSDVALDVRLLCTVTRPLDALVSEGSFRQDLLHRVQVLKVKVPSLTERMADFNELCFLLIEEVARRLGRPVPLAGEGFLESLAAREWPGGVRELRNHLEKLLVLSEGATLRPETSDAQPGDLTLDAATLAHIRRVLALAGGNKSRAAELLGIDRSTLYAKLKEI